MKWRSCLYECRVLHHRLAPKVHQFHYRIFMVALDLDEIDALSASVFGFSRNRRNIYEFRDRDHLADEPGSVKEKLLAYLTAGGIELPQDARAVLVTLPRIFGYIFNPVSFYFCSDSKGRPLCSVVQVGNTFGEMKLYLLPQPSGEDVYRLKTPKHFYVSPFSGLESHFDFQLRVPGEELEVQIDNLDGGKKMLLSQLSGQRTAFSSTRLAWYVLKYPLLTLRIIFLIHWHALLLWAKRLPWFVKGADLANQRQIMRPHASLLGKTS